ncbi:radical SAM family heme chaperone HemW [Iodidimonas sp. SYSU 1G8]|uniref:radical SAM family heme chaperone HemW n=1 Tax=Iodidimonas sp. SYSU 1G8 TaxID=3133967 RepID=UPI0031FF27A8
MPVSDPSGNPGFGVYLHWPFCLAKCPYCDFNSHVRETVDQARWRAALLTEIDHTAALTPGRVVTSVFFGGGTPSLMDPETVAAAIERIGARWGYAPDPEITLEANPTSVEAARFAAYAAGGVNRVSLGVQALNDVDLKALGRGHSSAQALAAIALARDIFPRYSFDLIYARPGQTVPVWQAELAQGLALAGDHLSLYQLTIEEGTAFHAAWREGRLVLPDEDTAAELYETTQAMMAAAGMPAYEISNHAAPGGHSRHNMTYWRYGEYAGIGPGAHGRLHLDGAVVATAQRRKPETWLDLVEGRGHGTEVMNPVAPVESGEEMIMMGLRTTSGVDLLRLEALTGAPLDDAVDRDALAMMLGQGLLVRSAQALTATPRAWPVLNEVIRRLLG